MRIILFILMPVLSFGQDSLIQVSKYEEFVSATGRMIKTEYFDAGSQKDFKVQVAKSTDIESSASAKSVQIYQTKNMFLMGSYSSGILFIDWDEVPGFLKALKYQTTLLDSKPANNISYQYTTTNGVISSCGYSPSGPIQGWSISFSMLYKHLRTTVPNSTIVIKKKDLNDIIELLDAVLKKNY